MKDIAGKTAFITGGGSGIGLAMARALAREGARIVIADIDEGRLQAGADTLAADGAEVLPVRLDVTDPASWTAAKTRTDAFGPVSILCSNAGVGGGSGVFETYDPAVWRWNYAVNADAHLHACRTFLGDMKTRGDAAHLVITVSMVAIVPPPISAAYISSKYAALGIGMALRNELAGTNVGISVLCPGMAATAIVETTRALRPALREAGDAAATSQAMQAVLAGGMPPGPIGDHVVRAVRAGEFFIFTHPEWKPLVEREHAMMLAAFGASADPRYAGDDIEAVVAANRRTPHPQETGQ
ncbi:SDR family NAD(P)-dependent oxidoreductase [Sphingosinicella soli]|uniref:NAD(P)-dependent dehydrogenase (Short-subunit alcohol dehydrogenase family) n=1 Tax=Sphingosinicella soli TaxID=333708 RepID=A0A7W7B2N0_9SPHN|nr:SDR family NAD(P)-dependent oxidoreductase [Sphingosinicella soli]MBB4632729.1 NAD(P)-dependent dehydrogenase (short-subunit alcohol dehydrogenase family) [Sphingosinicella soli]